MLQTRGSPEDYDALGPLGTDAVCGTNVSQIEKNGSHGETAPLVMGGQDFRTGIQDLLIHMVVSDWPGLC